MREAIANLISAGLLEQAPNRSAVVAELSREDIVDLYEVREALETYAVHKVAQRGLHPANHAQLKGYLDSVQTIIKTLKQSGERGLDVEQMAAFSSLDMKIHALLVLSTRNVRMQKIVADTRVLVRIFAMHRKGHEVSMLERIRRQQVAIVSAVAKGRVERPCPCSPSTSRPASTNAWRNSTSESGKMCCANIRWSFRVPRAVPQNTSPLSRRSTCIESNRKNAGRTSK